MVVSSCILRVLSHENGKEIRGKNHVFSTRIPSWFLAKTDSFYSPVYFKGNPETDFSSLMSLSCLFFLDPILASRAVVTIYSFYCSPGSRPLHLLHLSRKSVLQIISRTSKHLNLSCHSVVHREWCNKKLEKDL